VMLRPAESWRELIESSNAAWISVPTGRVRCDASSRLDACEAGPLFVALDVTALSGEGRVVSGGSVSVRAAAKVSVAATDVVVSGVVVSGVAAFAVSTAGAADVALSGFVAGAYPRAGTVSTGGFGRAATGLRGRGAGRAFGVGSTRGACCSTGDTGWVPREEMSLATLFDVSGGATRRGRSAWFSTVALRSRLSEQADTAASAARVRMSVFIRSSRV
jgi:hypothetical protein